MPAYSTPESSSRASDGSKPTRTERLPHVRAALAGGLYEVDGNSENGSSNVAAAREPRRRLADPSEATVELLVQVADTGGVRAGQGGRHRRVRLCFETRTRALGFNTTRGLPEAHAGSAEAPTCATAGIGTTHVSRSGGSKLADGCGAAMAADKHPRTVSGPTSGQSQMSSTTTLHVVLNS